jgi:hypothetical protein
MHVVDVALNKYITMLNSRGIAVDPDGFRAVTLAKVVGVSTSHMSAQLQDYRYRQSSGKSRYIIGCEEYGPRARWKILAKPGTDPKAVQKARRLHAMWLARDTAQKFLRDVGLEVTPALKGAPMDPTIQSVLDHMARQIVLNAELVRTILEHGTP